MSFRIEDDWGTDHCPECGAIIDIEDDLCTDCGEAIDWMYGEDRFDGWDEEY